MYFKCVEELSAYAPIEHGVWKKERLKEYLIQSCNCNFSGFIDEFLSHDQADERLAELLFDYLLNDDYDGSDCQIGAAAYIARMERDVLRKKKDLLLRAQENEVDWKRPFHDDGYLEWL